MKDTRVNGDELKRALTADIDELLEKVTGAMNSADDGRIIADSEEPVRDANAVFRQRVFEKALSLLQKKQEAFSPSAQRAEKQRQAGHDPSDDQRASPGV